MKFYLLLSLFFTSSGLFDQKLRMKKREKGEFCERCRVQNQREPGRSSFTVSQESSLAMSLGRLPPLSDPQLPHI
jgi:hypothetical protein